MTQITTCQICGRAIKAAKGLIAHHGYRRPGHGWQTASCFGAKYRPYEVACDALPPAIKSLEAYIEHERIALAELLEIPPRGLLYERRDAYGQVREYARSVLRPEGFTSATRDDCKPGSYAHLYHGRRHQHESNLAAGTSDLKGLRKRLVDWKAPLAS